MIKKHAQTPAEQSPTQLTRVTRLLRRIQTALPVLVADAAWLPPGPRGKGLKSGVNLVTVSPDPAGGNGLLVEIQTR